MSNGLLADPSGMSRAEKKAALLAIQGNVCAVCITPDPVRADHDHATGLLRGMLCEGCNVMEGKTQSAFYQNISDATRERFDSYRASPPAGRAWLWDLPDDWSQADTADCRASGVTILEYVLTIRPALRPPAAA